MDDRLPLLCSREPASPCALLQSEAGRRPNEERNPKVNSPYYHPVVALSVHKARHNELAQTARNFRIAAEMNSKPNVVERFFVKRREGKVTWIETVMVHRSA